MALRDEVFKGVVNDPEARVPYPQNGSKTRSGRSRKQRFWSRSFPVEIKGNGYGQLLGKRIGDTLDGLFVTVKEGEENLAGYTLQITGGSDRTGTPMRSDIEGGARKSVMTSATTGYKGKKRRRFKSKRYRHSKSDSPLVRITTPEGLRQRRVFRGNTITADIVQINLKVVQRGAKSLLSLYGIEEAISNEDESTSAEEE